MATAIQKSGVDDLILDHYKKSGGLIKNGEMVNREKKSRAEQWLKGKIKSGEFVMEDDASEFESKTDEELQNIMRGNIDNSHISSSVYHKAKQELEFRESKKNSGNSGINIINNKVYGSGTLIKFGSDSPNKNIKKWYEKPFGQIIIGLVILIIGTGIITFLGWN